MKDGNESPESGSLYSDEIPSGYNSGEQYDTGKSLSEALIFASTNPQYDYRLFIELQVQCMKITSSEHVENMFCTKIILNIRNNFCTQHVLPRFELGIFMS